MIRLLGSRKFIKMPPGTLYVEHWKSTIKECVELIDEFSLNPSRFFDTADLRIYYDNSASLIPSEQRNQNELVLTDINVVGDACPGTTLRVVIDINDLPDAIQIRGEKYEEMVNWTKPELLKIINDLNDDYLASNELQDEWAIKELNKQCYCDAIMDVDILIDLEEYKHA